MHDQKERFMKILIVEDNLRLVERMKYRLEKWYVIETASTGHEALTMASSHEFNAVLLDLGLPDMNGLEVCQRIREASPDMPIIIITGVDEVVSKVQLLDAGADDYITKPFDAQELRARINALIRRRPRLPSLSILKAGDLIIDPSRRLVSRSGEPITLRRKEFDILEYLVINKGRVLTRDMIVSHAWTSTSSSWTGSVDVHVKHLRDKVDKPFSYPLIKTVYAVGYMIDTIKDDELVDSVKEVKRDY